MKKSTRSRQTKAGMAKAAALGRKAGRPPTVSADAIREAIPLGTMAGARSVGLSKSQFIKRRRQIEKGETDA